MIMFILILIVSFVIALLIFMAILKLLTGSLSAATNILTWISKKVGKAEKGTLGTLNKNMESKTAGKLFQIGFALLGLLFIILILWFSRMR